MNNETRAIEYIRRRTREAGSGMPRFYKLGILAMLAALAIMAYIFNFPILD